MPYTLKMEPIKPVDERKSPHDLTPPHLLGLLELSVRMRLSTMTSQQALDAIHAGRCQELAQVIGEKGDVIMFKGKKQGESAAAFNALAEAITFGTLVPGGIRFLGYQWVAEPVRSPAP